MVMSTASFLPHVEEARAALVPLEEAVLAEEILLSVAGDLGGRSGADELPGDASPIPLPERLQPHQERPVLLLRPRHAFFPLLGSPKKAIRDVPIITGVISRSVATLVLKGTISGVASSAQRERGVGRRRRRRQNARGRHQAVHAQALLQSGARRHTPGTSGLELHSEQLDSTAAAETRVSLDRRAGS